MSQREQTDDRGLIQELERLIDRSYFRHPLPHSNRILAIWYCLTAAEDAQRVMFATKEPQLAFSNVIFYLDRFKYSMRYALQRIAKETTDHKWTEVPRKILPKMYTAATRLMFAGVDYALGSQLCGALHTNTASVSKHDDAWRVLIDNAHHDKAYAALELIGVPKPKVLDFGALLYHWVRNPEAAPAVVKEIAKSVSVTKDLLTYSYMPALTQELARHLPQPPALIPAGWQFSWGGRQEMMLLCNSLSLRCIYHFLAVHFGGTALAVKGMGVSNILLVLPREQLITDIELMSSLDVSRIRKFAQNLTWGAGTDTPDPALQPLIPLASGYLAIPCMHLLTSSQERNLLSLMARTNPSEFDAQSHLFEKDMVARLIACSPPPGTQLFPNIRVAAGTHDEEVDLLLLDEANRRMLVCELRWMLGPGDPREVQNRKRECLKKVAQVRRKVERLSGASQEVAARILGRDEKAGTAAPWIVAGVVLIAGYGGTRSPDPQYPIMPVNLFEEALNKTPSLQALWEWIVGLSWLPRDGKHFTSPSQEFALEGSVPLIVEGANIPDSAASFRADALASLPERASA